ncbi:hypothetical protein ABN584_26450 [Gloeocapsa sp. BRSZ]
MQQEIIETQAVMTCSVEETRDWYAWNNLMPPQPDDFHVVGEVKVNNTQIVPMLSPKEPQGINPEILMLQLILIQQPGVGLPVITWVQARYNKVLLNSTYKRVEIFCEDEKIADVPVEDIH